MALYNSDNKKICAVCNVSETIDERTDWCMACQMNAEGMLAFATEIEKINKSIDNLYGFAFQKGLDTSILSQCVNSMGQFRKDLEANKLYKVDYASKYNIDLTI